MPFPKLGNLVDYLEARAKEDEDATRSIL